MFENLLLYQNCWHLLVQDSRLTFKLTKECIYSSLANQSSSFLQLSAVRYAEYFIVFPWSNIVEERKIREKSKKG